MSTLIVWRDEFNTGSAEVDFEHRELVDWINRLHAELGRSPTDDRIADFLGEIHAMISAHFALEEKLMRAARYSDYEAHKADHEDLLDDIRDIMDDVDDGQAADRSALGRRLEGWFSVHFRTHDAQLHSVLG